MSFSKTLKEELCERRDNERNPGPVLTGMLLCSRPGENQSLGVRSESRAVAELFGRLLLVQCQIELPVFFAAERLFCCETTDEGQIKQLNRLKARPVADEEAALFIRGAFLVSGYLTEPTKQYQLSFSLPRNVPPELICQPVEGLGFSLKEAERKENETLLYLKDSEQIEEFLTWIGGTKSALALMDIKIYKGIRNRANRLNNFDTANIEKAASSGAEQCFLIGKWQEKGLWPLLPDTLKALYTLRLNHPEVTLAELGAMMVPPMSRSAVYRRMEKLKATPKAPPPGKEKKT